MNDISSFYVAYWGLFDGSAFFSIL